MNRTLGDVVDGFEQSSKVSLRSQLTRPADDLYHFESHHVLSLPSNVNTDSEHDGIEVRVRIVQRRTASKEISME